MKSILFMVGVLCSMGSLANDYTHLMTTHEKCSQWGDRGRQIVTQLYEGAPIDAQYSLIEKTGGGEDIVSLQKNQVKVIYDNAPKDVDIYSKMHYSEHIAKLMYDQCIDMYKK